MPHRVIIKKKGTTTNTMFRLISCKKMVPGNAFAKGAKERSSKNNITVLEAERKLCNMSCDSRNYILNIALKGFN